MMDGHVPYREIYLRKGEADQEIGQWSSKSALTVLKLGF